MQFFIFWSDLIGLTPNNPGQPENPVKRPFLFLSLATFSKAGFKAKAWLSPITANEIFFFLFPILYSFDSISNTNKRTDYPGKKIAAKVQIIWDKDFEQEIEFITGNEWKAGNLSYHLKSRPKWEGFTNKEILENSSQFICVDDVCLGRY